MYIYMHIRIHTIYVCVYIYIYTHTHTDADLPGLHDGLRAGAGRRLRRRLRGVA